MFKFLRKYNKWILAVGGTLLMIVFLVPQAIQSLSQQAAQSGATRATVGADDTEVTLADLDQAQRELQALDRLGLAVPGIGRIDDPWHWYLLTREADQAGLIGSGIDALFTPEDLRTLQQQSGMPAAIFTRTMANMNGVARMLSMYQRSAPFSDRRLMSAADRLFYSVHVNPVVIAASADAVDYEPTEDEIVAQMEAHADQVAGVDGAVFGYKLPDRVKLEWLTITRDAVRAAVEESGVLSGTALRKHWMQNAGVGAIPPLPDTPAATVPEEVRTDLLDELTDEKLGEISRNASNLLRARTHALSKSEGYFVLGDDWADTRLDLRELATSLADRFEMELPVYESSGEWLDTTELRDIDGLGDATTDKYPPGLKAVADLVAVSKEFGGSTTIPSQAGVAGPPMNDNAGNLYFFRVLDTDAARAPTSVDEVRDEVIADLKRKRHFETLRAEAPAFEQQAETDGLMALAMAHGTTVGSQLGISRYDANAMQIQQILRQPLTPEPTNIPGIGVNETAVDDIIGYARQLPPDTPMEELSEEQRVVALPVEDALAVLVYRIVLTDPVTTEYYELRAEADLLQQILLSEELEGSEWIEEVFGYEALAARHNFHRAVQEQEETTEDAGATPDVATAAVDS